MEMAYASAGVALEEPPIKDEPMGRERSALRLLATAHLESHFEADVDGGACNLHPDGSRRCDGGRVWSIWQIRPSQGLVFTPSGGYGYGASGYHGVDLVRSWPLAARFAHRMMRESYRKGSLCVYTGEDCGGEHPLADWRERFAEQYMKQHPMGGYSGPTVSNL